MTVDEHGWTIIDLADTPSYKPSITGEHGTRSVSAGLVVLEFVKSIGRWYPYCKAHGAMNKVTAEGIWRCFVCHEGCFEGKASNTTDTLKE